jgi:hypothetical protein
VNLALIIGFIPWWSIKMAVDLGEESAAAKLQRGELASADRVPNRKLLFLDTNCLVYRDCVASAVAKGASLWLHHL